MARFELFGANRCPYTRELREWPEWLGQDFVEYDVEVDRAARERMRSIADTLRTVPVLVEEGKVVQVGRQGRGCIVD